MGQMRDIRAELKCSTIAWAAPTPIARKAARVVLPMCGVRTALGVDRHAESGTQRRVRETIETRVLTARAQFALQGFLIEEASTRGIRDDGPSLIVARR